MNFIIDRFLIWWLHSGRYRWSWLRRRLFERRYLTMVLPEASSLEEIEASLRQITWTMDGPLHLFDCISYPQATWAKKKDDCDGFASVTVFSDVQEKCGQVLFREGWLVIQGKIQRRGPKALSIIAEDLSPLFTR